MPHFSTSTSISQMKVPPTPPPPIHLSSNPSDLLQTHDNRDAQELPEFHAQSTTLSRHPSDASTEEDLSVYTSHRVELRLPTRAKWYEGLVRQWERNVYIKVPVEKRRDHLALERTYLGYLRTSLALSMVGVIVAQLFRLQSSELPGGEIGYFVLGVPLAACFIGGSVVVILLGAVRFWRQQTAMVKGKVWAGGWEVLGIMCTGILVSYTMSETILLS
jgi:uncharacterized membrane protein YidH (DUF202 family)